MIITVNSGIRTAKLDPGRPVGYTADLKERQRAMQPTRAKSSLLTLEQIFGELIAPVTRVDERSRRIELCTAALSLVDRRRQPELWAAAQLLLG